MLLRPLNRGSQLSLQQRCNGLVADSTKEREARLLKMSTRQHLFQPESARDGEARLRTRLEHKILATELAKEREAKLGDKCTSTREQLHSLSNNKHHIKLNTTLRKHVSVNPAQPIIIATLLGMVQHKQLLLAQARSTMPCISLVLQREEYTPTITRTHSHTLSLYERGKIMIASSDNSNGVVVGAVCGTECSGFKSCFTL